MNAHANNFVTATEADASLASVLAVLAPHSDKKLMIEYAGRRIEAGYHVTEVKAGSFVTLDCGGNPDAWQETILQVEDIPAEGDKPMMTAGKFAAILAQVDKKLRLNTDARLTFEVSRPGEAMQVFDVAGVEIQNDLALIRLRARPAICKPRHRAAQETAGCCTPSSSSKCC